MNHTWQEYPNPLTGGFSWHCATCDAWRHSYADQDGSVEVSYEPEETNPVACEPVGVMP